MIIMCYFIYRYLYAAKLAFHNSSLGLPHHLVHCLGNILDVPAIRSSHADASILRHVDMCILPNLQHLLLAQPRETKHPNLLRDMLPAPFFPIQFLKIPPQRFPHIDDTAAHGAEIGFPLFEEFRVVEHQTGDASTVSGWVTDFTALENRKLRCDSTNSILSIGTRARDEMECTGAFTIQTEILGE